MNLWDPIKNNYSLTIKDNHHPISAPNIQPPNKIGTYNRNAIKRFTTSMSNTPLYSMNSSSSSSALLSKKFHTLLPPLVNQTTEDNFLKSRMNKHSFDMVTSSPLDEIQGYNTCLPNNNNLHSNPRLVNNFDKSNNKYTNLINEHLYSTYISAATLTSSGSVSIPSLSRRLSQSLNQLPNTSNLALASTSPSNSKRLIPPPGNKHLQTNNPSSGHVLNSVLAGNDIAQNTTPNSSSTVNSYSTSTSPTIADGRFTRSGINETTSDNGDNYGTNSFRNNITTMESYSRGTKIGKKRKYNKKNKMEKSEVTNLNSTDLGTSMYVLKPDKVKHRNYICTVCAKGLTTSGHLARHYRIHTGEKNHFCPYKGCNLRFSRHDNCIQHYRTHLKKK